MSADFWAGYISGAAGIVIGNPFDVIKVRLQAARAPSLGPESAAATPTATPRPLPLPRTPLLLPTPPHLTTTTTLPSLSHPLAGIAAPILGYGALNALLFITYNRTESLLTHALAGGSPPTHGGVLSPATPTGALATWTAGAAAGLATWAVSTPTELIKCRAQLGTPSHSSAAVAASVWRAEGLRGLYLGGAVTALRDAIGYGFYFWSYALLTRASWGPGDADRARGGGGFVAEAARVLVAGGLSGIATWVSIYPLDVIKTRVQAQVVDGPGARVGAWEVYRRARREGRGVLFRGLPVCCLRAFVVNAVQWGVYEMVMYELGQGKWRGAGDDVGL